MKRFQTQKTNNKTSSSSSSSSSSSPSTTTTTIETSLVFCASTLSLSTETFRNFTKCTDSVRVIRAISVDRCAEIRSAPWVTTVWKKHDSDGRGLACQWLLSHGVKVWFSLRSTRTSRFPRHTLLIHSNVTGWNDWPGKREEVRSQNDPATKLTCRPA